MLTGVCLGESICNFGEGSSNVDRNCVIESLPVSDKVSAPHYMRDSDSSNNVGTQDISEANVREGSFGSVDMVELPGANFREGSVTEQLCNPSCTENNVFLRSVDAQHIEKDDFQEGSSVKPNIARKSVTQQLSDPLCSQNGKFSKCVDGHHFADADFQEGLCGIDITTTIERISVREQLSDSSCTDNDDFSKSAGAKYFAVADSLEGSSAFDIKPIPQVFSSSSCSEDDDFFKSVDGQHFSGADIEEGSSAVNINSTVERITISEQLSGSSCPENADFSGSVDAQHLAGVDLQEGSSASDTKPTVERISVDERLAGHFCTENDNMSKTVDACDISGSDVKGGSVFMNINSTANISSVTGQLSGITCTKNDYLFKCMDGQDLCRADFGERFPTNDLACTIEKLSVSRHSFEPSCVGANDFSKDIGASSLADNAISAFDSIKVDGPFGHSENGGEDTFKIGSASEVNQPDCVGVPPEKRSLRNTRSRQNALTTKPARKRRNVTNRKASMDLALFKITRKRRSCYNKRARSSVWGLINDIRVFETTTEFDVNISEPKKLGRVRGGQARGQGEKKQPRTCSKKSERRSCGITGHISLKVRVGKEVVRCPMVDVFSTDNNIEGHYKTAGKSSDLPKEEELPTSMGFQGCKENSERTRTCSDDSTLDFHLGNKNNHADKNFDDLQQSPSANEVDKLGASIDSRGLDPGTSPDSEVINQNLDASYVEKGLEDFPDILSTSKACLPSEDVLGLSPMQKNIKKGKKKKKMLQAGNCSPNDELSNSEIVDNGLQLAKVEHGEKGGDVTHFAEASASAATGNVSGNTSSTGGVSAGFGMFSVTCKVESGGEMNVSSSTGNRFESSESQKSNKVLPHSKGQKISKSVKTEGMRDSKPEVPAPANKRGSTSRKKVNRDKSASKHKLKPQVNGGLTSSLVEGQAHTGYVKLLDHGESGAGNSSLTADVSSLEIEPAGGMEQITKPRNAWVLCDDCNKWRRIPATLADQIEDANCRWTCKDNTDKKFADCSVPQEKSNAEINAELDISDASGDDDAIGAWRNSDQSRKNQSTVAQQPKWRPIRSNLFLHRNKKNHTIDEIMVCHCKPASDGRMSCGDGCLNRMLNIECVQGTCPCGELCSNQQFQKRKYTKLKCVKCGKKGHGLQVLEDISEGQFLIEYVGEVLDMPTYEARQRDYALMGHKHFYFMTLSNLEVIDASAKGNLGRFINHSCEPNCRTEKWIVNGEVCIGIFALRNIKKGEEVTFDYNYVRVFGAAAKKCVCGSSQCRGYIGGDPQNAEVIVQDESDDEYQEPVTVHQDGLLDGSLNDKITARNSFGLKESRTEKEPLKDMDRLDGSEHIVKGLDIPTHIESARIEVAEKVETDNSTTVAGPEEVVEECVDSLNRSTSAAPEVDISAEVKEPVGKLQFLGQLETVLHPDDLSSVSMTVDEQKCSLAERSIKRSSCSTAGLEESPPSMLSKCVPIEMDSKRKLKSGVGESRTKSSKSHPSMKISRSSSSSKKEKPKSFFVIGKRLEEMQSKSDVLSCKSKKIVDSSLSGRFEAVQEKLNELLDHEGGISKRRDSSRGYLKLLLLTAASGDSGDGETIQSNRDLSMILDALLKTKSRTVLVDIMNKNGLQMLHNMLKRYRKEFKKIPILRKLLKVFEYLATREILTSEQINGGPPCPGVESFRESILSFTEHTDKQVHQIARSFRDRWIPRAARKSSSMDWEDNKTETHRGLDCGRVPPTHNRWSDRSGRQSETPDCIRQTIVADACIVDGSCPSSNGGTRTRKRKSRWDQPEDPDPRAETNIAGDGCHNIDDDAPPGFAAPLGAQVVLPEASTNTCIHPVNDVKLRRETVLGHPQQKFISRLPVSYGIPLCTIEQVGTPQPGKLEGWLVAPGMPFNPFPPLPSYPREKRGPSSNATDTAVTGHSVHAGERDQNKAASHYLGISPPSSSKPIFQEVEKLGEKNKLNLQQSRGFNTLGRKYFRQQKWNNSKHVPPWIRNRNNWGFMGNNSRNGMYNVGLGNGTTEFRNSHGLEKVNGEMDGSAYYHHQPQPY